MKRLTPSERKKEKEAYKNRVEIVARRKSGQVSVLGEGTIGFIKASIWYRYRRRYGKSPNNEGV